MLLDRQDAGIDQIELVEVIPFYGDIDFWRQPESPLVTVQPVLVTAPGVQKAGDIGKELLAELFDLEKVDPSSISKGPWAIQYNRLVWWR